MATSTIGVAIPVFLMAIVLIFVFSVELNWLPSYGRGETVNLWGWETGFLTWDGLKHLILPSLSLATILLALFIRLVRAEMMEVLETEYIKFAWAKGLHNRRVWFLHAFKNTLLPVITVFGVQIRHPADLYDSDRNGISVAGDGVHVSRGGRALRYIPIGGLSGGRGCNFCCRQYGG